MVSNEGNRLEVVVKYKDVETKFAGEPDQVIRTVLSYVRQVLPGFEIVSGLTLTVEDRKSVV